MKRKLPFAKVKKVKRKLKKLCDVAFSKIVRARGHCELKGLDSHPCQDSKIIGSGSISIIGNVEAKTQPLMGFTLISKGKELNT